MKKNCYMKFIRFLCAALALALVVGVMPIAARASNDYVVTESPVVTESSSATEELTATEETAATEETVDTEETADTNETADTDETDRTEPSAQSITYDPQPGTKQEVQVAIDEYNAEYQAVLVENGLSAALEVAKPHWESEVAASIMPEGYRCELVTGDAGFGADYYTFFVNAMVMTTEPWDTGGIIVETEAEFRAALADATYTTIYLGADITMESSASATVAKRSLVINGTDPRPGGTRHTYRDYNSATASATLRGPCTDITFKDIEVYINTYFGIYQSTASGETVTLDGVTGQAAQFYYGYGSASTLVIKDSELTLTKTHTYTQELAQNAGMVRFEGAVVVTRESGSYPNAYWDEIFYLTGTNSTVEVAAGANVTLDNNVATGEYGGGAIFYAVKNFVVGAGASFTCYSTTGFADLDSGALGSVTVGEGADVRFICTTSHYWGNSGLRGTNFTAGAGSNFLLYNVDATASYGAFHFTNVKLDNPESFVVLNPSSAAIGTNACNLTSTSVLSIRYYLSPAISGLFDPGSYAYIPTANYSKLWVQSTPFNVSTTTSWTNASPAITTNYSTPSASAAETSITSGNFSARTVYGIEIRGSGSSYTAGGTVSGLEDNSNLTITYTIDNGTAQTVTTDANGDYVIEGIPYGAKVVITPPAPPQYCTLSPTSITLDSVTAASTDNDFTYTKTIYKVTEKYVDEEGNPIQNDTTGLVDVDYSYTFTGTTANIIVGTDIYVYLGYKLDSYTTNGTLDGTGTPVNINLTGDKTVYYVYEKLTIGSITIEKYGDNSGSTALSGAEFTIERWDSGMSQWVYIEYSSATKTWSDTASDGTHYTQTTGTGGTTTFADLPLNKYRIQEVASPIGYAPLREPIITEVPYTINDTDPYYSTVTGGKTPDNTVLDSDSGVTTAYYYNMTYAITDTVIINMPAAGGGGSPAMLVLAGLGTALIAAAGYIFSRRRKAVK